MLKMLTESLITSWGLTFITRPYLHQAASGETNLKMQLHQECVIYP